MIRPTLVVSFLLVVGCGGDGESSPTTTIDPQLELVEGMVDPPVIDDADVSAAVDTMQVRLNEVTEAEEAIRATCESLEEFGGAVGVTGADDDWRTSPLRDAMLIACPEHVAYADEIHSLSDE